MNPNYFVDENILASLLKSSEAFWPTAYSHYRDYFENYFLRSCRIEPAESREAFQKAFALLLQGLEEGVITPPVDRTLFVHLVSLGYKVLRMMAQPGWTKRQVLRALSAAVAGTTGPGAVGYPTAILTTRRTALIIWGFVWGFPSSQLVSHLVFL